MKIRKEMTCVILNRGTWGNLNLEKNEKEWKNMLLKFEIYITFNSSIDVLSLFLTRIQFIDKLPMKTTVFLVSVTSSPWPPVWYNTGQIIKKALEISVAQTGLYAQDLLNVRQHDDTGWLTEEEESSIERFQTTLLHAKDLNLWHSVLKSGAILSPWA